MGNCKHGISLGGPCCYCAAEKMTIPPIRLCRGDAIGLMAAIMSVMTEKGDPLQNAVTDATELYDATHPATPPAKP